MNFHNYKIAIKILILITILALVGFSITAYAQHQINILSLNGDTGYKHDSKSVVVKMIEDLGAKNNWKVTITDDPAIFTTQNLAKFEVIIF